MLKILLNYTPQMSGFTVEQRNLGLIMPLRKPGLKTQSSDALDMTSVRVITT
jgi:hypothetical protein